MDQEQHRAARETLDTCQRDQEGYRIGPDLAGDRMRDHLRKALDYIDVLEKRDDARSCRHENLHAQIDELAHQRDSWRQAAIRIGEERDEAVLDAERYRDVVTEERDALQRRLDLLIATNKGLNETIDAAWVLLRSQPGGAPVGQGFVAAIKHALDAARAGQSAEAKRVERLREALAAMQSERDTVRAMSAAWIRERDIVIKERDTLRLDRDQWRDSREMVAKERDALQLCRDTWIAERDGWREDCNEARRLLADAHAERDALVQRLTEACASRDKIAVERAEALNITDEALRQLSELQPIIENYRSGRFVSENARPIGCAGRDVLRAALATTLEDTRALTRAVTSIVEDAIARADELHEEHTPACTGHPDHQGACADACSRCTQPGKNHCHNSSHVMTCPGTFGGCRR